MPSNEAKIRKDFVDLWKWNVDEIMFVMKFSKTELATRTGISRQTLYKTDDKIYNISGPRVLGTMYALRTMIDESDTDKRRKERASKLLDELDKEYREKGLL